MKRTLFAAAAAAALLTGASAANAADRIKIEMWQGLTGDLGDAVNEVCQRFNASQDQYEISCPSQGSYDAAVQNAIAAFRAKKQPTIVQVFDVGTLDLMLSGAFVPAKKLMEENGYKVDWADYFPGIANYYANSKGEMYSFPFNSSTALLYWNKDAFAKIGKTEAPKTWEEVEADSKAMKAAGIECPVALNYDTWVLMEQFSAIHNLPISTKANGYEALSGELVVNKTKFVDYVKFLKKGLDEGLYKIKLPETGQNIVQAFASGDCQMMLTSVGDHGTVGKTAKPDLKWGVAMLPVYAGTERKNSLVGGASLWVLSGKSKDEYKAAAAFFAFIAKPESAEFWSTRTGYIPVTKSGFEYMKSKGFYDKPLYAGRELALASLSASDVGPNSRGIRLGGFIQIRKEFRDALTDIFAGKVEVQAGIDAAVERSNAILRRFEKTYQGKELP